MGKPSVSIVLPAHNEEENIERVVRDALSVVSRLADDHEVIVVDDGSADRTADIVRGIAREGRAVRLLQHPTNRGYGAAVWTGLSNCRCDLAFFTDADDQFELQELEKFVPYAPCYEAVVGYRARREDKPHRYLLAKGWGLLVSCSLGVRVRDLNCAFKLFHTDRLRRIDLYSTGALINGELLARLIRGGARIIELPVQHRPRVHGEQSGDRPSVILRALRELACLCFRMY
jgi:glycosyltransferase involved in cell wall biosynthesis